MRTYTPLVVNPNEDTRPKIGETSLPPVDRRTLLHPSVRCRPWVFGDFQGALALPTRGWVVGRMENCAERSGDCQVKLWEFHGDPNYPWKRLNTNELIVVFAGVLQLALRKPGKKVAEFFSLRDKQWVILRVGVEMRALSGDHLVGLCVRWPSVPDDKVAIREDA